MKIIVQNVVREPSTLEIRRRNPGSVVPAPLIGGHRLPPRRSRTVETAILDDRDFLTLADMTRCGVLRVFTASPYRQLSEEDLRAMVKSFVEFHSTAKEAPPVTVEVKVATEVELEVPLIDPTFEFTPEPPPETVPSQPSRDELLDLKNAELRTKLAELGGGNGTGLSKAQLVDAILERLA